MSKERSAAITIGGKEYELVLTTRATKEIAGRYGGLENLGDKLMKSENFEMALDEIIWLITLLANQSVLIHNLQHPEDKKEPLTSDRMWELRMTVCFLPRPRIISRISMICLGSRPTVGSSRMITWGFPKMAWAMPTRCR